MNQCCNDGRSAGEDTRMWVFCCLCAPSAGHSVASSGHLWDPESWTRSVSAWSCRALMFFCKNTHLSCSGGLNSISRKKNQWHYRVFLGVNKLDWFTSGCVKPAACQLISSRFLVHLGFSWRKLLPWQKWAFVSKFSTLYTQLEWLSNWKNQLSMASLGR